ncbi:MAG: helix-turn-helix domain-containing protein [Candidatus Nanopelagicales bacterium]
METSPRYGPCRVTSQLGDALRSARRDAGLTQAQLADRAGVSRQWVNGVENNDMASPDLAKLMRVFGVLGVEVLLAPLDPRVELGA